jgi:hypothetical protein
MTGLIISGGAFAAWNPNYECVSNDAKKTKLQVSFLDPEILRSRDATAGVDRYYRVTDSADDLLEAMILGTKAGETAHLVPVSKGTMHLTMTRIDAASVVVAVKVGKLVHTYSCK